MPKKALVVVMLALILLLSCGVVSLGVTPEAGGATAAVGDSVLSLATPEAQSPAAGICAAFEGTWVTITINPDTPDPRCASIRPDQKLEVVNGRGETLSVSIGNFSVELAPGESHKFDLPFGEYLAAPGVHRLDVQPCCGAELVLSVGQ